MAAFLAGTLPWTVLGCWGGGGPEAAECRTVVPVDLATAPELARMIGDLAARFNRSDEARDPEDGSCAEIRAHTVASSEAETRLAAGWPAESDELPAPVIWSPGSSTWATLLDQHVAERDEPSMAYDLTPIARTPLVFAMPRSRAEALGWPDRPLGFEDLVRLAGADLSPPCDGDDAPAGMRLAVEEWCANGWGDLRLGKTDPFLSTSGLGALVAQAYAATRKDVLIVDDLDDPAVGRYARGIESAVVHYGGTPRTFLENWYRRDVEDLPGSDVSAVAVEEKAVIDYNRGDPRGRSGRGETGARPRERLVAVYPEEGTFFSDNPLVVVDAPWVGDDERAAARRFVAHVRSTPVQEQVLDYGFRPVEPAVDIEGRLFSRRVYGVDPAATVAELPVPDAAVLDRLRTDWLDQRRAARALLLVDVSGSMGLPADLEAGAPPRKLDLVKEAATGALARLDGDDEVGLWIFSTTLTGPGTMPGGDVREVVPVARLADVRESLPEAIRELRPHDDTALYAATGRAYEAAVDGYDPARINAVVLLTDGHNEVDNTPAENRAELHDLLATLSGEGRRARPVRVFTIAYGEDADAEVLQQIAEATDAAFYDSSDPDRIERVFREVMSNF